MLTIKIIFHYQVRQERIIIFFSSRKEENK